jgi:hypothetical protein
MPFTPDAAKPPLLDEIAAIRKAQALWTLLGATGGSSGLALLGPIGLAVAGVAALCLYALEINKIDLDRILNDPPRPDFDVPVRARRRRFDPTFMQTPVERAGAEFVTGLLDLSAYLEAAVRADERAQAAIGAGATGEVQARMFEGQRATERAASAGEDVAITASTLAAAVSSDPAFATVGSLIRASSVGGSSLGDVDAIELLPPEALEYVRRTTLVTTGLTPIVQITSSDATALRSNPSRAIRERAAALGGATLIGTRVLHASYGDVPRSERIWRGSQTEQSRRARPVEEISERAGAAERTSSKRRTEAARRWLANFVDMYAGIDAGEGDPVHAVRENARALLATGPTERDPVIIAEQIAVALPGDPRAAALAEAWRDELRRLGEV